MSKKAIKDLGLIEQLTLASAFLHGLIIIMIGDDQLEMNLLFYVFVFTFLLVNNHYRGTRIHLYPLCLGFAFYSLALLFELFMRITLYYYFTMTVLSIVLVKVFGNLEYYKHYEVSGRYAAACVESELKVGNRVLIYYPT